MSDDDDFFMDDYDDGGDAAMNEDDSAVAVENTYYTSKDLEGEKGVDAAIEGFQSVIRMEKENDGEPGRWSFKATKKLLPLVFKKGDMPAVRKLFFQLLDYGKSSSISENDMFKSVAKFIDFLSGSAMGDSDVVQSLYDDVLGAWRKRNENLWFKMALKLTQRLYDRRMMRKLPRMLEELRLSCRGEGAELDMVKKGNQLLDVLSLEIQLAMDQLESKRVFEFYELGMEIARKNPGVLNQKTAIFHFVGGKMRMENGDFAQAYQSFFEAFKFFEEAGSKFKIPCLRYIIVSNMLLGSSINPFSTPETRNLQNHAEIKPFSDLLDAFQSNQISRFEKLLHDHRTLVQGDVFVTKFIDRLLRELRTQLLLELIMPYTSIRVSFLAQRLHIEVKEVRELLICLILDGKLVAKIDEMNGVVSKGSDAQEEDAKLDSMATWARIVDGLADQVFVEKLK